MPDLSDQDRDTAVALILAEAEQHGEHVIADKAKITCRLSRGRHCLSRARLLFEHYHHPLEPNIRLRKTCDEPGCIRCWRPLDEDDRWVDAWTRANNPFDHKHKCWRSGFIGRFQRDYRAWLISRLPTDLSKLARLRAILAIDAKVLKRFQKEHKDEENNHPTQKGQHRGDSAQPERHRGIPRPALRSPNNERRAPVQTDIVFAGWLREITCRPPQPHLQHK